MTEETIFAQALEKSTPIDRTAYLDQACAGDTVLRQRIETLLKSHDADGNFLGKPAIQCAAEELAGQACAAVTQSEVPADDEGVEALDFLAPSTKPGALGLLGHYEILEVIGRGGMGIVLRAVDEKLQRVVAIKVMAAQLATNATARRRFIREAQAAAAVTHDHLVTIHAVEEASGLPYLVMQYVSGMSLQERLDRSGPLELREIVRIGMQTAAGLAAAHAHGLIHRDIKPANILLENGVERVKITDFGLARAVADASLTQSGVVAGTPQYMSPEQARGEAVDQRTDLFSLGSVLYAMCTGRPPFRADSGMAVLKRVCDDIPSAIRETSPEVPDWLVAIVTKLHAKNPADRFQSATEIADLLKDHLAHVQHPSVVGPVAGKLPAPSGRLAGGEGAVGQSAPRRRRWAILAAVLLCLVGGLAFSEATGVTKLRSTVIRIFTPDGTLVVEVDDPGVKVTVEGDGGLVITGTGLEEIRLRPGSYKVHANRDGKPVLLDREVVSIARGGREIVKVKLEAAHPAPALTERFKSATPILVMHFDKADFYEKDGKTYVRDRSGNGNDGLCEQVQFTPEGKVGGGLANDGKGFLRLPASLITGKSNFTIGGWAKPTSLKRGYAFYTCLHTDYPVRELPSFNLFHNANHLYAGVWNTSHGWIHAQSPEQNISPGEWTFVAATLENGAAGKGRLRLMLNDRICERSSQQVGGTSLEGINDIAALKLEGVFDELAVWDRALSDQELQDLFALGHAPAGKAPAATAALKATSLDPDRKAAEYVLSIGGTVCVNDENRELKDTDDLPPEPFRLTLVNLSLNKQVSDAGLAAFTDCKNLTHLYLGGTPVSNAGLAHFKDCKNLLYLWLHHTQVSDAGLVHFKDCKKLTFLHLACTQVSDVGLANFKDCNSLEALDLENTKVSNTGLEYFKDCKNLTSLVLHSTQVGDAGLAHLKDCKNLTLLNLQGTQVSDAGLAHFKDCKNLTVLHLGSTKVSDEGLAYFQDCRNLRHLYLGGTQVSNAGLVHFKDCKDLVTLALDKTQVSDEGLAYFQDCKNLTKLTLSETQASDAGLKHLAGLKKLDSLDLRGTRATAAGVAELQKALSKCKIDWGGKGPGQ